MKSLLDQAIDKLNHVFCYETGKTFFSNTLLLWFFCSYLSEQKIFILFYHSTKSEIFLHGFSIVSRKFPLLFHFLCDYVFSQIFFQYLGYLSIWYLIFYVRFHKLSEISFYYTWLVDYQNIILKSQTIFQNLKKDIQSTYINIYSWIFSRIYSFD